jgi:ABC-2 type transport system ATP-binding protein
LQGQRSIRSVAQLGTRLHVLIDPALADAQGHIRSLLAERQIPATVQSVRASLEDVFVAATGFGGTAAGH